MADDKRTRKGQFKKGQSGNLAGRPSKKKQAEKIIQKMKVEISEDLDIKDSKDSLEKLLAFYNAKFDEAKSPEDQEKFARYIADISNKLLPFQKSRYSSIDSDENKVTELSVTWEEPEEFDESHPMNKLKAKNEANRKHCVQT